MQVAVVALGIDRTIVLCQTSSAFGGFAMDRHGLERLYKEADSLYRSGAVARALDNLDRLNAQLPDNQDVLYARARCLIALGRKDDAREQVDYLVNVLGAPRAKGLLARIDVMGDVPEPPPPVGPQPIDINVAPPDIAPPRARRRMSAAGRTSGLIVLAIIGLGAAALFAQLIATDGAQVGPASDEEIKALRAQRRELQEATKAKAREDAFAKAKAPEPAPGREIPSEEWMLTAIDGIPVWKPGVYRDVPCKGNGSYTITVYVPMAFQERPDERFAGLMISMPEGDPGFQGFKDYAERNDMIIVSINNSSNATYRYNEYAQELAFNTIVPSLRIDPNLGFTYGASGGARTNWDCMCRHPTNFAGLMQVVFGDGDACKAPPRGVRVAFLYGDRDFNRKYVERTYKRLLQQSYDVQAYMYTGDHFTPPPREVKL